VGVFKEKLKEAISRGNDLAAANRQIQAEFKRQNNEAKKQPQVKIQTNAQLKASLKPAKAPSSRYTKDIDTFIGDLPSLEYDFIALDFETANRNLNSACALGIAAFRGKEVVHNSAILIDPRTDEWLFYDIHGIRPSEVQDAPMFSEVLTQLYPLLEKTYVIAHNATRFDSLVFSESAKASGFSARSLVWADSKNGIPTWAQGKYWALDTVAQKLGLPLDHHSAGSDAKVAGQIWTTGMAEYRGSNRVALPERSVRQWPSPGSFIVPPKVKIYQSAFDKVEADLVLNQYGSPTCADLIRLRKGEEISWAIVIGKRQIGSVEGASAKLIDDVFGDEIFNQRVNVLLARHGLWGDGGVEFLNEATVPKGYDKAPIRLPSHSQLEVKIEADQLKSTVDQIRGKSKRLHIKEVGNIRFVDGELRLFHGDIYVGDLDMTRHGPTAKKFKDLCAEGYLPMVDYYIKLTSEHELEFANVFYDLRWR
jgi:DNA polymerase-3 subunit epsilon